MVRPFLRDEAITPEILKNAWDWMKPLMRLTTSYTEEELSLARVFGVFWSSLMERCISLSENGIPMLPVRYEDLKNESMLVMEKTFSYCGVEAKDPRDLEKILKKDSQAGTVVARDITQKQHFQNKQEVMKELHNLLATRPVINRTDYVLPDILTL